MIPSNQLEQLLGLTELVIRTAMPTPRTVKLSKSRFIGLPIMKPVKTKIGVTNIAICKLEPIATEDARLTLFLAPQIPQVMISTAAPKMEAELLQ